MSGKSRKVQVLTPIQSPDKDPFLRETSRSYKKCQQNHTLQTLELEKQRRNIATEEKLARERYRQETKEVQADLYRLKQAQAKAGLERKLHKPDTNGRRGRRPSAEFEDLDFDLASGKVTTLRPPRRLPTLSPVPSPRTSRRERHTPASPCPSPRNPRRESPRKCFWVGDPEAISSVRRRKKTVAEQQEERYRRRGVASPRPATPDTPPSPRDTYLRDPSPEPRRRFFSDQAEPGMPLRMIVRDQIPSRDRTYGRRRSLSNPEPIDLGRLSVLSERSEKSFIME